eukprot:251437-Amphidinium_carterae.1
MALDLMNQQQQYRRTNFCLGSLEKDSCRADVFPVGVGRQCGASRQCYAIEPLGRNSASRTA